jgi:signal peptidase
MEVVNTQVLELKKLWKNKRQLSFQGLNLAMIVFSALMIWKGLMFVTKSESPVVVVLRSIKKFIIIIFIIFILILLF